MKANIKTLFLLPVLTASLGLILAARVTAQTFTHLHSFTAGQNNPSGFYTNSDGATPEAGVILAGNTLYGTASIGGSAANGAVFGAGDKPILAITLSEPNVILTWT